MNQVKKGDRKMTEKNYELGLTYNRDEMFSEARKIVDEGRVRKVEIGAEKRFVEEMINKLTDKKAELQGKLQERDLFGEDHSAEYKAEIKLIRELCADLVEKGKELTKEDRTLNKDMTASSKVISKLLNENMKERELKNKMERAKKAYEKANGELEKATEKASKAEQRAQLTKLAYEAIINKNKVKEENVEKEEYKESTNIVTIKDYKGNAEFMQPNQAAVQEF